MALFFFHSKISSILLHPLLTHWDLALCNSTINTCVFDVNKSVINSTYSSTHYGKYANSLNTILVATSLRNPGGSKRFLREPNTTPKIHLAFFKVLQRDLIWLLLPLLPKPTERLYAKMTSPNCQSGMVTKQKTPFAQRIGGDDSRVS